MNPKKQTAFISWRFYLVLSMIALASFGLVCRVFDLAVLDQPFLKRQGDDRVLRLVSTPAFRGMIVDRNNSPLAVSTTVYSLWMNPRELAPSTSTWTTLGRLIDMKPAALLTLYKRNAKQKREFAYLKRGLSPEVAANLKALNLPGLYLQRDYRRYYPEGEIAAQIIGMTNIDDQGQEGLELAYDHVLAGEPGKKWVVKDRLGRVISDVELVREQKRGLDLILSIDKRIQYLAYRELLQGMTESEASSATAVVLDVETGEVLAMVNVPSFNPNKRPLTFGAHVRNRAVTDLFEPGSTMKAISVASVLESGRYTPDTRVDTYPGWIRVGHNVVKDGKNNGVLTVRDIVKHSSNVGVTKMVLGLPPDHLWELLHRVGFGELTQIGFPGEQSGSLVRHHTWGSFTLATLAFGYGVSVTTLQLARAYAILANHGKKLPVSLLRVGAMPTGEAVIAPNVADQMLSMLESVISKDGTAPAARITGYRVAGKTGTARMALGGGYHEKRYISSFVGIAPVSHPRFVVAVVVNDPRGKQFYGGAVAAPIFAKIMEGALRLMDVAPDA